jgi:hypothetical protein
MKAPSGPVPTPPGRIPPALPPNAKAEAMSAAWESGKQVANLVKEQAKVEATRAFVAGATGMTEACQSVVPSAKGNGRVPKGLPPTPKGEPPTSKVDPSLQSVFQAHTKMMDRVAKTTNSNHRV